MPRITSRASGSTRSCTRLISPWTWAPARGRGPPLQVVAPYAVFANGGFRVTPYLITRIVDARGNVLSEVAPPATDDTRDRALDPRNAWTMPSMMKDVIKYGPAARAMSLNRTDLAGKTGTTNENVDAWFCGFDAAMVGVSWI